MATEVEFGTKAAADEAREEWADYLCPIDDDRRTKTVAFVSDTPEGVLDMAEARALESKGERTRSVTADLSERERERISDLGGFDQQTTTANWRSAKGVFAREGVADQFHDAMGALTDYDDPARGAEEWVARYQEGGGAGGARDDGAEQVKEQRTAAKQARAAQGEQCDHAADHCRHGDPEACEFLTNACGYDDEEVEHLIGDRRHEDSTDQQKLVTVGGGEFPEMEVTPEEAGALRRSWRGYNAATGSLDRLLSEVREEVINARQAWSVINNIREEEGQQSLHPDRLHELLNGLDAMPTTIPEVRTLAHYGASASASRGDTSEESEATGGADQFANERQGTLGTDVEAEQAAEDKQVTLTGEDESESAGALPAAWSREGSNWVAGPYRLQLDSHNGNRWNVRLMGDGNSHTLASGLPDATTAEQVAEEFMQRVSPDEVSFHSNDAAVVEAAAEAKAAAGSGDGGLSQFSSNT